MTPTLVRERVDTKGDQNELDQLFDCDDLASQAAERLSYTALREQLPVLRGQLQQRISLKEAMSDLGIEPFNREDVETYKEKMAWRVTPLGTRALEGLFLCILAVFVIGLGLCGVSGIWYLVPDHLFADPSWAAMLWTISWKTSFVAFVVAVIYASIVHDTKIPEGKWILRPINKYHGLIPEFAVQSALDLQERCPSAEFFVDSLEVGERTFDPFLVVSLPNDEKHYFEVWNEPRFKQKRQQ